MIVHRGWSVFLEAYLKARHKKHGRGKAPFYEAIGLGLMSRAISISKPMPLTLWFWWKMQAVKEAGGK